MVEIIKLRVKDVYKLRDDYDNIFINNTANYTANYDKVQLSSRTVNKTHYDDVFVIEPNSYYYIELKSQLHILGGMIDENDFIKVLRESGLILQFDKKNCRLYLYNANQNVIYIQEGAVILKKEVR